MRTLIYLLLASSPVIGLPAGPAFAQEAVPTPERAVAREHHPWGSLEPGAWKRVRVLTEMLDGKGLVQNTSITETKTVLLAVEEDGVTLLLEVLHEVAGKRFAGEPKTIQQGFHGELTCKDLKITSSEPGTFVLEGRKIPCKILRMECPGATGKNVTDIYYSDAQDPYILKRESVSTDLDGKATLDKTTVEVLALDMPVRVMAETKRAAYVRAVRKLPTGTVTTWLVTSTDVPGGVISYSSKEVDQNGRLIRCSTLELTAYGLEPDEEWTGLFGRKRPLLRRKPILRPTPP
ncbi:MAG: hypothetical protein JXB62_23780 [Pirellulales bacterium]|nr:hypothetical protein [Pirellulales bacterium]